MKLNFIKNSRLAVKNGIGVVFGKALSPLHSLIGRNIEKFRVSGRLRLLNKYAYKKPKLYLGIILGIVVVLFIGDCISIFVSDDTVKVKLIKSLKSAETVSKGVGCLARVENAKDFIYDSSRKRIEVYVSIAKETDSIMKRPIKTKEDSIKVYHNYKILKTFLEDEKN